MGQERDKVDSKVGSETLAIVREEIFIKIPSSVRRQVWDQVKAQISSQIIRYNFAQVFGKDVFK